jgi:P22_AR N-terminal domain.
MKTETIATIHNVAIVVIDNSEKMVPIKPNCDALGIDSEGQRQRILRDEILNSTAFMIKVVAADEKEREMFCIPFKFVFGWLFSIDTSRVNPESKDAVIGYKLQCYDALYNYFTEPQTYLKQKEAIIDRILEEYEKARNVFKFAKNILEEKKKQLDQARKFTIDEWRANKGQFLIPFDTAPEAEEGTGI